MKGNITITHSLSLLYIKNLEGFGKKEKSLFIYLSNSFKRIKLYYKCYKFDNNVFFYVIVFESRL